MASQRDLKKHFEAILGRELVGGSGGEVALRETLGLYSIEEGHAASRDIGVTGSATKRCGESRLLTVGGLSFVGGEGKAELRLNDFHCEGAAYLDPVILVATPHSSSPVFVTAIPTIVDNGNDVQIVFHTWAHDGTPATIVLVTWFCRVQIVPAIIF